MYLPVKFIFKILYRPRVAIEELEVSKKFTLSDSLLVYIFLGASNSLLYLVNGIPLMNLYIVLATLLFGFPLRVLTAYSLNFSSNYMFKKEINAELVLFFMVSAEIIAMVLNLTYLIVSMLIGKNALLFLAILVLAFAATILVFLIGISELSGLGFLDSVMVYIFSSLVFTAVVASAVAAAMAPFILLNLTYGRIL